jgi:hypothetical protein
MEVVNMPGGDGTGPQGLGPGTGWGLGPCGRGFRRGLGYRRMGFRAVGFDNLELSKEQETKILEAEKAEIEAELESIKNKLAEIKK